VGLCGVVAAVRWPSARPALDCPAEQVRWVGRGSAAVARCDEGGAAGRAVPPGPALTLRLKLDLNQATAGELALVSGIGPALAEGILRAREARSGFSTWAEVDDLPGIGPSKLQSLQQAFELRPGDGGASPHR
jgi:hypothetical protein